MQQVRLPLQHVGSIVDADFLAKCLHSSIWVVQQIVGVNNGNADFTILQFSMLSSESGSDLLILFEIVEDAAKLVVSSFRRHEVVETRYFVLWWDCALVVRGNTATWMADQESEVELPQKRFGDDGRIARFSLCVVWIWRLVGAICMPIGNAICMSIGRMMTILAICLSVGIPICTNALLSSLSTKRWSNGRKLAFRRDEIVCNIFDEQPFSLLYILWSISDEFDASLIV